MEKEVKWNGIMADGQQKDNKGESETIFQIEKQDGKFGMNIASTENFISCGLQNEEKLLLILGFDNNVNQDFVLTASPEELIPNEVKKTEVTQEDDRTQIDRNFGKDPDYDLIMDEDLAANTWPKVLDKVKTLPKLSICAQVMTKDMFEKYKDMKTSSGWDIARAINSGVRNIDSLVGCHVGDVESYFIFKDFFRPIIEHYHQGYDMDNGRHVTDMNADNIAKSINPAAKSKIISTRIRVARNLNLFPLNTNGTKESRLEIANLMEKVFSKLSGDLAGTFHRHTEMSPQQTQQLIDDNFLFRGKDRMQAASGYHEHWPHGRGIFVSHHKQFVCWVNEGDHIRIISMETGIDVKSVFSRLERGVRAIEDGITALTGKGPVFLNDPALGMITCCPSNLGTGMRGSCHVLLPNLISFMGLKKIDELARTMNCQARGSSGEHSQVIDRIDISNWRRLGLPEYELVEDMITCVNKLSELEDNATLQRDVIRHK